MNAREAAEAVHKLALRCDPIPQRLADQARPFVDEHRVRDPHNRMLTLDGRDVRRAWPEDAHPTHGWDLPELLARMDGEAEL